MEPLQKYANLMRQGVWPFLLADGSIALYSPRTHDPVLRNVTAFEASRLNSVAKDDNRWKDLFPERDVGIGTPSQISAMALLPSACCNFHCSYCYAAGSHGSATLGERQLQSAIKYFFDRWGGFKKYVTISILGGGEPLCAPEITHSAMRFIRETEKDTGSIAQVVLVTNGSLVNSNVADALAYWNITPRVSFDVLPDIQSSQRGEYNAVVQGLHLLIDAGLEPEIRTVVTSKSVGRLCEIVECVLQNYPQVHTLRADPVIDADVHGAWVLANEFPARFSEARQYGRRNGLMLDCLPWRLPFWGSKPSFCPGEFCVSPDGTLGICHWKSGYKECSAAGWNFGEVAIDGSIHIDESRLSYLTRGEQIQEECRRCVLGEVCRGWCKARRAINGFSEVRKAHCQLLRKCFDLVAVEWLEWQQNLGGVT